jgi:glycosyltransferase involved in cell wall biosynthesis
MAKILVLATSPKTKGGITAVIKAYQQCDLWDKYHCRWIATHSDKSGFMKVLYLIKGWLYFMVLLPFYDLVHIHTSEPPSAIRKCLFMPFVRLFRKKVIVHFHSFSPDSTIKSRWACLYQYLFDSADVVVALSPHWKREIENALPTVAKDKIRVLYNPCISEPFENVYPKRKTILFAGVLVQRKGYTDLIRGFAQIAHKYPEWKLVMAGRGDMRKAQAVTIEYGVEDQVEFAGWVSGKEKDKLFKEASVFCLPSYAEGFPMAVLDAWAYGLPVIATPVGGLPDIAVDGENILLFPVGDVKTLSVKLELIINNNELREKLSSDGLKLSKTVFDKHTIASQLAQLYSILVASTGRIENLHEKDSRLH